mgnify:CR=1 FL=1
MKGKHKIEVRSGRVVFTIELERNITILRYFSVAMVKKQVADLPAIVSKDEAYQNAIKNSDARNARVESDRATMQAILDSMSTTIELYKAVNENPALCKWIQDMVFANTYQTSPPAKEDQPDFD